MAFLSLFMRRQMPPAVAHFARTAKLLRLPCAGAPLRRLHGSPRLRLGEQGPWGKSRAPENQYQLTDLDKADALMLRKSHETGDDALCSPPLEVGCQFNFTRRKQGTFYTFFSKIIL